MTVKPWIEAMRLRTLPVSVAGVVAAAGYMNIFGSVDWPIFILCLLFAVIAQIDSNFANEYFDFKAGLDKPGRQGPRRGVSEGDIPARSMLAATVGALILAGIIGMVFVFRGGPTILLCGILILIGALAYSAGPFPLSHYCLGEVAVVCFFGLAPVCLTFYLTAGYVDAYVLSGGVSMGLMGANVLLVNNIRDISDDRSVKKHTLPVVLGRRFGSFLYLFNGWMAVWLMGSMWLWFGDFWIAAPAAYLVIHTVLWYRIDALSRISAVQPQSAHKLNPFLGMTAVLMLLYALSFAVAGSFRPDF